MPKAKLNKMQKTKVEKNPVEKIDAKAVEKQQQVFKGRVVSTKTAQTATVLLESRKTHPLYKKSYAHSKKYLVQDDLGVKLGDLVEIIKCKPMSKNKHFKIVKVVGRDIEAIVTEKIKEDVKRAIEEVIPVESDKSEDQNVSGSVDQNVNESEKPKEKKVSKK